MTKYTPVHEPFWAREYPSAWRDVDKGIKELAETSISTSSEGGGESITHRRGLLELKQPTLVDDFQQPVEARRLELSGTSAVTASSGPIGRVLSNARDNFDQKLREIPFRILFVVTTLSEHDKGTRGTTQGADRLQNVLIPVLQEATTSMVEKGWEVDVYLILGYGALKSERRALIESILPPGVGLEIWDDAQPLYYKKRNRQTDPNAKQKLEIASHGLSRQHRYVVRDKLNEYDMFACFEDDIRITADHILNFLEMSAGIEKLRMDAEASSDGLVHVVDESTRDLLTRAKPMDKAPVGNDVVDDPLSVEYLSRVIPGFLRVEVLDKREQDSIHVLLRGNQIESHPYSTEVPVNKAVKHLVDPNICCREDSPGRGKMPPGPNSTDLVIWETNVGAMGVRRYPDPIGWVGALPVQDLADVGSYWSGEGGAYSPSFTRPRRRDATLGQQAGWMATRSQVEFFHKEACPGGFLPPFTEDDPHWRGDSLQKYAVEHWSGGFQLFGECQLNRIMSLNPKRFSAQLLYHTANNKQWTKIPRLFTRAGDLLGQLHTVKNRAAESIAV